MRGRSSQVSRVFLLGVCLLATFACENRRQEVPTLTVLKVGVVPVAEAALLLDSAVFAKHGIIVSVQKFQSGTFVSDGVIGGGLDAGYSNLVTPLIANARDIQLRIIGPITVEDAVRARHRLVRRTSERDKPLDRRVLAINAPKNIDNLMLIRWLDENGVDTSSVRLQTVAFPAMLSALEGSEVAAVALVEPFVTKAREFPAKYFIGDNYYASAKSAVPTAVSGFIVRKDWISSNASLSRAFHEALLEAALRADSNRNDYLRNVRVLTGTDSVTVSAMPLPWYRADSVAYFLGDLASVAWKYRLLPKEVVADSIIYTHK